MDAISVDLLRLTRAGVPEMLLRPGATVVVRVLEREGTVGRLSLAGATIDAELPHTLKPGETVRLQVVEATTERLVFRTEPPPVMVPMAVPVPLPGGRTATVRAGEREVARTGAG